MCFYPWKHLSGIFDLVPLFTLLSQSSSGPLEKKRRETMLFCLLTWLIDNFQLLYLYWLGSTLKETGCWKMGYYPARCCFFHTKKYTRMLSGGSCRAGLCSGHHTSSLFYGLSDSLKPCCQNSKYMFIFKSPVGSINSLRVFPVHGQIGGFVFYNL